jgi:hydrogenase expression/formation protein HypE
VISPLFFPGGDIGALAVHGTVNDVAMAGARPLYLAASFILEEGLPLSDLERIVASMGLAARAAGVQVVAGDTKVVERGKGDGCFITTTGHWGRAGSHPNLRRPRPAWGCHPVSGSIGDHGVAILSKRENLGFETEIVSDSQALNDLVAAMIAAVPASTACAIPPAAGWRRH